jgi:hypothetical protein
MFVAAMHRPIRIGSETVAACGDAWSADAMAATVQKLFFRELLVRQLFEKRETEIGRLKA